MSSLSSVGFAPRIKTIRHSLCAAVLITKLNQSQAAVLHALEDVCSIVPGAYRKDCLKFVDKYGAEVAVLIVKDLESSVICNTLLLCVLPLQRASVEKVRFNFVFVALLKNSIYFTYFFDYNEHCLDAALDTNNVSNS